MPRTYSENSEPRKVYQADTIRGFTEDDVKDALAKAGAIQMPAEYVNDLIFAGFVYSKDNPLFEDLTVDLTDAEYYDLFVNGNSVEKSFTLSQGNQPHSIYLTANVLGHPVHMEVQLSAIIYTDDLTSVTSALYVGFIVRGNLFYISANFDYSTSTLTLTAVNMGA